MVIFPQSGGRVAWNNSSVGGPNVMNAPQPMMATGGWGGLFPYSNSGPAPMATGSICILGANGQLVPLVPAQGGATIGTMSNSQPALSTMATGSICFLSNSGQIIPLCV